MAFNATAGVWSPAERYTYEAYGAVTVHDPASVSLYDNVSPLGNTTLYTGREYSFATQLYYYRARYYDATLGRFVGRDPILYGGNDRSFYRYCENNPVQRTDPNGTSFWDWVPIVGTAINCFSARPFGSAATDYAGCARKCRDDVDKQLCRSCVEGEAWKNIKSYALGALPGTAVDLITAGILVGVKKLIGAIAGGILFVDAVINVACTLRKVLGISDAASNAMTKYCS